MQFLGNLVHDLRRRVRRREHPRPGEAFEARHHRLVERRQVRQERRVLLGQHRERTDLLRLHLRQAGGHVRDHHLDMAGHEIRHRERVAAVRHPHDVDAGALLDRLPHDVAGAVAGPIGQLARLGLGERHQFGHRRCLDVEIDGDEGRKIPDARDRREVLDRIVGHALVERDRRMRRVGGEQQRVAVGMRVRDRVCCDHPVGTRLVLDHEGMPERLLQILRDQARRRVGLAARRERRHDRHGARRIRFGPRGRSRQRRGRRRRHQHARRRPSTDRARPQPRRDQDHRFPPLLVCSADMRLG